jgi:hypothetical protein
MMRTHVESLRRFIDLGTRAGVDVVLSPTLTHANFFQRLRAWRYMNPDESGGGNPEGVLAALKLQGRHILVAKEVSSVPSSVSNARSPAAWRTGS